MHTLYDRMDPSLRFPSPAPDVKIDREADFHDVACPLNYVKTRLLLEQMEKGQVLSVTQAGGRWQVIVRKS